MLSLVPDSEWQRRSGTLFTRRRRRRRRRRMRGHVAVWVWGVLGLAMVATVPGVSGESCACQGYWEDLTGERCGACSCPTYAEEGGDGDPVCVVSETGCAGADGTGQCVCCSDTCNFFHTSRVDGCECSCGCCSGGGIALIVVFSVLALAGFVGLMWAVFVYPRRGCCWPFARKPLPVAESAGWEEEEDDDGPPFRRERVSEEDALGTESAQLDDFEEDAVQAALALSAQETARSERHKDHA